MQEPELRPHELVQSFGNPSDLFRWLLLWGEQPYKQLLFEGSDYPLQVLEEYINAQVDREGTALVANAEEHERLECQIEVAETIGELWPDTSLSSLEARPSIRTMLLTLRTALARKNPNYESGSPL